MFLPLLPLFAQVAPEPQIADAASDTTRVAISVDANVTPESTGFKSRPGNARGVSTGGNATLTLYPWAPLLDDESPRSLQPFLQRTSALSLEAGGSYSSTTYSLLAGGGTYTATSVPASASVRWFVLPSLALLASAGASYGHGDLKLAGVTPVTSKVWHINGSVGADVRSGDASITLQWQPRIVDETVSFGGSTAPAFFAPRFTLAGRIVVDRHYDVTASASLIPDGAVGRAGFGWYPTTDLGLSVFARLAYGQIYANSTTDYDSILVGPTFSYWVGRRVELSVSYEPEYLTWARGTQWLHFITVAIAGRIPAAPRIQETHPAPVQQANPPPIEQPNPPPVEAPNAPPIQETSPAPVQETPPIPETKPSE